MTIQKSQAEYKYRKTAPGWIKDTSHENDDRTDSEANNDFKNAMPEWSREMKFGND